MKITIIIEETENICRYRNLSLEEALLKNEGGNAGIKYILGAYKNGSKIIQKSNGDYRWVDLKHNPQYFEYKIYGRE